MTRTVTLQMIAEKVGVSKSTVSDVLRRRVGKVRVSQNTKERILQAVKELNYEPNAAARALVTGKTHNIAFLLSSKTNLGLANNYFATLMSGVQMAAKNRGYNCIVNCYDLSSIKEFVLPSKFKRRSVDGMVISGRIEEEVLQVFIDSGFPFILVGENADFPVDGVLSIARNIVTDWVTIFEYLYSLGHRHMAVGGIETVLGLEHFKVAVKQFDAKAKDRSTCIECYTSMDSTIGAMENAYQRAVKWSAMKDAPTAIIGHDQFCVGFAAGAFDSGKKCPEDFSLVSSCDTSLCKWSRPKITAMALPLFDGGRAAADLLIDYIEKNVNWLEANRKASTIWYDHELIVRESCGSLKK